MSQKGFRLDLNLCTGCSACAVACAIENQLPWGSSWRWVDTFNEDHLPGIPQYHLSLACNHCADAPCMHHCPALAYSKDATSGAVLLDPDSCIGCKYCTWACPYDAPRYDASAGVVSKCTFCHHRQEEGLDPACVTQCPTGALGFGVVDGLGGSAELPGFPETPARPSIRFVEPRDEVPPVDVGGFDLAGLAASLPRRVSSKTSLRSEWPLLVFSLLCAFLVGAMSTAAGRQLLGPLGFLVLAVSAAAASSLHLGKKHRAWRAVLNWRRSWVSREIILFGLFGILSALHLMRPGWFSWAWPALVGFALLHAIDRVYRVLGMTGLRDHSAQTLLTGVLVAASFAQATPVFAGAVGIKLGLYSNRSWKQRGEETAAPGWLSATRILVGLVAPVLMMAYAPTWGAWPVWGAIAVGELIDRIQFYREIRVPTPRREIRAVLDRTLADEAAA